MSDPAVRLEPLQQVWEVVGRVDEDAGEGGAVLNPLG